ncbi:hypothetical protein [Palleronia sp.]|uniref:hypothetical protein n=1 Tax=Palleronia sp. TaxID=1940284 RepID=UPI0035C84C71
MSRQEELSRFANLRTGEMVAKPRPTPLFAPVILIVAALALFVALGMVMAPRVVAQTAACAGDGCPAPNASLPF